MGNLRGKRGYATYEYLKGEEAALNLEIRQRREPRESREGAPCDASAEGEISERVAGAIILKR